MLSEDDGDDVRKDDEMMMGRVYFEKMINLTIKMTDGRDR